MMKLRRHQWPGNSLCENTVGETRNGQRGLVLGKTEAQDAYIVFTGSPIMLTRSIRRIATDWKCHLGFYLHFNARHGSSKAVLVAG